jgi:hypothetical protein
MKLKILILTLKTNNPVQEDGSKLRGYIGKKFPEYPILHHHVKESGYLYTYPRVQYKVLGYTAVILGIEEGAKVLKQISDEIDFLLLGQNIYRVTQRIFYEQEVELQPTQRLISYKFISPWIALNPKNYQKFQELWGWKEKKELLNSILIGNVLSMCKGLGIVVDKELYAHSLINMERIKYKSANVVGFTGEFKINFKIPDYFGLGKGVSQGFGVVINAPHSR